tara:strand:- start:156 stop:377 length:222 start_codon:yes stop_codon:yes gene_type:complete
VLIDLALPNSPLGNAWCGNAKVTVRAAGRCVDRCSGGGLAVLVVLDEEEAEEDAEEDDFTALFLGGNFFCCFL